MINRYVHCTILALSCTALAVAQTNRTSQDGPIANTEGIPITVQLNEESQLPAVADLERATPVSEHQSPQMMNESAAEPEPQGPGSIIMGDVAAAIDTSELAVTSNPSVPPVETAASSASKPVDAVSSPIAASEQQPLGASAASHRKSNGESSSSFSLPWIARTAGALIAVIGTIFLLKWLVQTMSGRAGSLSAQLGPAGRAPSGVLEILARYPVGRQQSLVLIKLDTRILLVAQTSDGFQTLSEVTSPDEVASLLLKTRDEDGTSIAARFSALLRDAESEPVWDDLDALDREEESHESSSFADAEEAIRPEAIARTTEPPSSHEETIASRLALFRELRA